MRFPLPALFLAVLLAACDDPECRPGEIKVGMTCFRRDKPVDAGDDTPRDSLMCPSGSHAIDAGFCLKASAEQDAAAEDPGAPPPEDASTVVGPSDDKDATTEDAGTVTDNGAADAAVDHAPACTPAVEICDGTDNDCDGQIDEDVAEAPLGLVCGNGGHALCMAAGKNICRAGKIVCDAPAPATLAAAKDDCSTPFLDENCDGKVNEGCLCGNGVIDSPEQCDDGNLLPDDSCSPTCTSVCSGGSCARLRRPNVLARSGDYVFTYVEYFGSTTTPTVKLVAYDAAGSPLTSPFTDPDSQQTMTSSAISTASGYQSRVITISWLFSDSAVTPKAVTFRVDLSAEGKLLDMF